MTELFASRSSSQGSEPKLDISVVIPTYNRRELLGDAVQSLCQQTYPADRYEIVIVSDGSTDGTEEMYSIPRYTPITRLVRQVKRGFGAGAARNLGAREARGEIVLFFDDDMVADARLVEEHVLAHARLGDHVSVRGRFELAAGVPHTRFTETVLADTCYPSQSRGEGTHRISFDTAITSQLSFKRSEFLNLGGFDESFRSYGWEDVEFAYRAERWGMKFYFEPSAVSLHRDQSPTLEKHAQRLQRSSRMAPVLFSRHADLRPLISMYADKDPIRWKADGPRLVAKKLARRILALGPVTRGMTSITPLVERLVPWNSLLRRWYYLVLGSYVLVGYREGIDAMAVSEVGTRY